MQSIQNPNYFDTHVVPVLHVLMSPVAQLSLIILIFLLGFALAHTERRILQYPLSWLLGAAIAVTALSFALNFMSPSLVGRY